MTMTIAILAGGLATRLFPISLQLPKSMIPINNFPFIGWQLKLLSQSGIKSVILCLGHKSDDIVKFVGDGRQFGLKVLYSIEAAPIGTGGALRNAEPILGEIFGVLYGDSYLPINYKHVEESFLKTKKLAMMTIFKNMNQYDISNVTLQSEEQIIYGKRGEIQDAQFIDYGFSVLRKEAIFSIPKNTFFDLSDLFHDLSIKGQIQGYEVMERFYEIGSFNGIIELENYLKEKSK